MFPFDITAPLEWFLGLNFGPVVGFAILGAFLLAGGWSAIREARLEKNDDRQKMFGCLGWALVAIGALLIGKLLYDLLAPPIAALLTLIFLEAVS